MPTSAAAVAGSALRLQHRKPRWVVDRVAQGGGLVYHDVTERKWALKGLDSGVRGLIAVNQRAGGHAGPKSAEQLVNELGDLGVPLVCAGGIGDAAGFVAALRMGYAGGRGGEEGRFRGSPGHLKKKKHNDAGEL